MQNIQLPEFPGFTQDQVATLIGCRTFDQYLAMRSSYQTGFCAFCQLDPAKNVVIQQNDLWHIWQNPYPHKHTATHLIMAPKAHIASEDEISADTFRAMGELFVWARKEFKLPGGGLIMRFGSPLYNTGTVLHLHANIMVPDGKGELRPPLAKESEELLGTIVRARAFEKMCGGVLVTDLAPDEQKAVEGRI